MGSTTDKLYALIFSEISLGLVIPIIIGVVILAFPTVIADFLATIHIAFPESIWGGVEIPLQYILTIGTAQGILTCSVPIVLGIVWNRWAGGASGFLCSLLFTLGMGVYYGSEGFVATTDWLGVIVAGMLVGYIAGALMSRSRMRGSTGFKSILIASFVAAIVAIIFTTQTYMWFSPMYQVNLYGLTDFENMTFAYFTYVAIYGVWALFAAIISKVASWFM